MSLLVRPADKIKLSVIDYLLKRYPDVVIGSEVMYGTSRRMVDLLALYRGETYAIEIKSERDSTRRLASQLREYALIFDYTIVFTHSKYVASVITLSKSKVAVFEVTDKGLVLKEITPYSSLEDIRATTEADFIISDELKDKIK